MASTINAEVQITSGSNGAAATSAPSHPIPAFSDPVTVGLMWVVGIVALAISIGKPIRDYLRGEKKASKEDKVDDAKSSAETVLYNHLADQVTQYRNIADQAFRERNDLIKRVSALEAKAEDLADAREVIERLKVKLEDKDTKIELLLAQGAEERKRFLDIISWKDTELAKANDRIVSLETRQRELELRLTKDETGIFVCPLHKAHTESVADGVLSHDNAA